MLANNIIFDDVFCSHSVISSLKASSLKHSRCSINIAGNKGTKSLQLFHRHEVAVMGDARQGVECGAGYPNTDKHPWP